MLEKLPYYIGEYQAGDFVIEVAGHIVLGRPGFTEYRIDNPTIPLIVEQYREKAANNTTVAVYSRKTLIEKLAEIKKHELESMKEKGYHVARSWAPKVCLTPSSLEKETKIVKPPYALLDASYFASSLKALKDKSIEARFEEDGFTKRLYLTNASGFAFIACLAPFSPVTVRPKKLQRGEAC
jgi:hypothetical protein